MAVADSASRRLWRDRRGATMTEYALMIGLVIVACVLGYRFLGGKIADQAGHSGTAFHPPERGRGGTSPPIANSPPGDHGASANGGGAATSSGGGAQAARGDQAGSNAAPSEAEVESGGGLWRILGALVGGFVVLGLYFVFRNAKRGAPSS